MESSRQQSKREAPYDMEKGDRGRDERTEEDMGPTGKNGSRQEGVESLC